MICFITKTMESVTFLTFLIPITLLLLFLPNSSAVVGGVNATAGEFPFVLSLQMIPAFGKRYHFCAGSIFNATHVVTPAQCVVGRQLDQIQIVAGAYNLTSDEESGIQVRTIVSVTIHPDWDPVVIRNDISLVHLNEPLQFNSNVQSMPLPPPGFNYMGNCTVIGWGSNLLFPAPTEQLLQKVNMTLVPPQQCQAIYQNIHDIDNTTMICAKGSRDDKTQGPCNGDIGGPIICKDVNENDTEVVAGIMSWSMIPCGDSSYPSIYTNITATLSAITGNIL